VTSWVWTCFTAEWFSPSLLDFHCCGHRSPLSASCSAGSLLRFPALPFRSPTLGSQFGLSASPCPQFGLGVPICAGQHSSPVLLLPPNRSFACRLLFPAPRFVARKLLRRSCPTQFQRLPFLFCCSCERTAPSPFVVFVLRIRCFSFGVLFVLVRSVFRAVIAEGQVFVAARFTRAQDSLAASVFLPASDSPHLIFLPCLEFCSAVCL
jgi:hypothetical protein